MSQSELPDVAGHTLRPREQTADEFGKAIGRFSPEAQDKIAHLSSLLLERDIKERIQASEEERVTIYTELSLSGLTRPDIETVFDYYGLTRIPFEQGKQST